jgi:DNA-dependent RNA polymerase auxiliary subunit epsilon
MKPVLYIYEDHLYGGLYISDHEQSYEERYCSQCGDSDWLYTTIQSEDDIKHFVEDNTHSELFDIEYILEIANELKNKLGEKYDKRINRFRI